MFRPDESGEVPLEAFDVTLTFCFTSEHRGIAPHHTSPPQEPGEFAEFCARMVRRYASSGACTVAPAPEGGSVAPERLLLR